MPQAEAKYVLTAVDKTGRAFKSVGRRFGEAAKTAAKFSAGIAAIGGAAFGKFAGSLVERGRRIRDLAADLGLSVENLSAMEGVLRRVGGNFDGYIDGIRTLQERLVELRDGTPSVVQAFDRIGLSFRDLEKLTPDEQVRRVIEALEDTENITDRNATAMELFGDEAGKVFIRLATEGTTAIDKLIKEQEKLGLTFDQKEVEKIDKLGRAWQRFKDSLTGAIQKETLANMEQLVKFVGNLANLAVKLAQFGNKAFEFFGSDTFKQYMNLVKLPFNVGKQAFGIGKALAQGDTDTARLRTEFLNAYGANRLEDFQNLIRKLFPEDASRQREAQIEILRTISERVGTARAG